MFYITAAVYLAGAITFLLFGTDQQQKWDKLDDENGDEQMKEKVDSDNKQQQPPEQCNECSDVSSDETLEIDRIEDDKVATIGK